MKISASLSVLTALVLSSACTTTRNLPEPASLHRENIDFGWKFKAGDIKGAEAPSFDDASWRSVNLPHDWSIEGNFSKDHPSFSRGGWLPTGKVVYRKTIPVAKEDEGKRFAIYFDGAYRNAEVFINGKSLGQRPLGYIAFHYELTDHLKFGADNVVTVKLDNSSQPGSRWYTGTGIYRHVHLIKTEKLYVPVWGTYLTTDDSSDDRAQVTVETRIRNDFEDSRDTLVRQTAYAPSGEPVATSHHAVSVGSGQEATVVSTLQIPSPRLWNPEDPNLYTIETELIAGGDVVYSVRNRTGIRTISTDKDEGFKLNGKVIKLKGVCLHHAGGPLGAAIHRRTIERQLEKLREMGCNAVRTAHNPFSEEFLDVCDEMGFLVMNEMFDEWEIVKEPNTTQDGKKIRIPVDYYASKFKEWADRDLKDFILRDRNHPSVIMWSTGNEIDQMHEPEGAHIAERLNAIIRKLDDRPITNGVNGYGWGKWPDPAAAATSDIMGYNYITDDGLMKERNLNPDSMAVVTEHESAQSFYPRSTYLYGEQKQQWWDQLGYSIREAEEWVEKRDIRGVSGMEAWAVVKKRPYVMGIFIWTGWDYLGEVIPFGWPARSSSFAPIDLAGFPKDGYYFYQSQWTEEPMVHIFPHWNLEGMEGKTVQVHGFTNGDELELFQDGVSLGRQANDRDGVEYQSWDVVYQPGKLEAVAYRDGRIVANKVVKTAAAPAGIRVESRRTTMKANGQDLVYLECTLVDENGIEVPNANNRIEFQVEGPAFIAGVGNGDNMGLEPFKANARSAFNGKCLAIIQSTRTAGSITCTVRSTGLNSTTVTLDSL